MPAQPGPGFVCCTSSHGLPAAMCLYLQSRSIDGSRRDMDQRTLSHPLHRAGSALASVTGPNRHQTEPQRHEKHSLHRRLHSNTITSRARAHSTRHHVKDAVVHSAAELRPPISFDHILRRDKKSPDSSRRGSGSAAHKGDQQRHVNIQQQSTGQEAKAVKPADVMEARKHNEKREAELRRQLQSVEELAMDSTRQLDDTHYTILEKASALRSMVEGLRRLAEEARSTYRMLDTESTELAQNTQTSLDAFGDFSQQERNIDELVTKLKSSKATTERLKERLEAARHRVEAYEKREIQKEKKRKKQWQVTWGTLVGIVLLLVLVVVLRNREDLAYELDGVGKGLATAGDVLMEGIASPVSELIMPSPSEDLRLRRLFDEL
nr:hypothetical protein CFP56_22289 [Quercus suber]